MKKIIIVVAINLSRWWHICVQHCIGMYKYGDMEWMDDGHSIDTYRSHKHKNKCIVSLYKKAVLASSIDPYISTTPQWVMLYEWYNTMHKRKHKVETANSPFFFGTRRYIIMLSFMYIHTYTTFKIKTYYY